MKHSKKSSRQHRQMKAKHSPAVHMVGMVEPYGESRVRIGFDFGPLQEAVGRVCTGVRQAFEPVITMMREFVESEAFVQIRNSIYEEVQRRVQEENERRERLFAASSMLVNVAPGRAVIRGLVENDQGELEQRELDVPASQMRFIMQGDGVDEDRIGFPDSGANMNRVLHNLRSPQVGHVQGALNAEAIRTLLGLPLLPHQLEAVERAAWPTRGEIDTPYESIRIDENGAHYVRGGPVQYQYEEYDNGGFPDFTSTVVPGQGPRHYTDAEDDFGFVDDQYHHDADPAPRTDMCWKATEYGQPCNRDADPKSPSGLCTDHMKAIRTRWSDDD